MGLPDFDMTKRDLLAALKKAKTVYVWVNWTEHDGIYLWVSKEAVRANSKDVPNGTLFRATLREDGDLYIG